MQRKTTIDSAAARRGSTRALAAIAIACAACFSAIGEEHRSVQVIKPPELIKYSLENSISPLFIGGGWLINAARNSSISEDFTTSIYKTGFRINERLVKRISDELKEKGIEVNDAPRVSIDPTKPHNVKYKPLADQRPVLHVFIEKAGLRSPRGKSTFQPVIHAYYCLTLPTDKSDCEHGSRAYYGDDFDEEDFLTYPADRAERWADENDVYRRIDEVIAALDNGLSKLSAGIAKAIIDDLSPASEAK